MCKKSPGFILSCVGMLESDYIHNSSPLSFVTQTLLHMPLLFGYLVSSIIIPFYFHASTLFQL